MPQVVLFEETGGADVLRLVEAPPVEPGAGEVRIRVAAVGLNRAEVLFREGRYHEKPEFPSRIGYEASGTIDAIGPGVEGLTIGARVSTIPSFSMGRYGVYGEQAIVPAHAAARYPERLTPVQAAAVWMPYVTAYGALIEYGGLKEGDVALITAASSSVGLAAIQIAKSRRARVIATTRGAAKKEFLLRAGADCVVVTDAEDLADAVMDATQGAGANVIFDPVVGPFLPRLAAAAAAGAMIFLYGVLASEDAVFPLFPSLAKGLTFRGYTLMEITKDPVRRERARAFVYRGLEDGVLEPVIDRTFPLCEVADAHRHMESNRQMGKIVVEV